MRRLRERVSVDCPVEEAEKRMMAFFDDRRAPDGSARIRLRVPMGRTAPLDFSIDRAVRVEARRARDAQNLNDVITVSWRPEGTTLLPQFEGTLIVWGSDEPAHSLIELEGDYFPPLGPGGQIFDEAIGRHIAQSTAHEFLDDIKQWIEEPPAE